MTPRDAERRFITDHELRVADGDKGPALRGYAALFNTRSHAMGGTRRDGGGFVETIEPGAFADALDKSDIRALWNHNDEFVLGRVKSGTLEVREDNRGLGFTNRPPDTQWARDLLVSIRRGDIDGVSFGFYVARGGDSWKRDGEGRMLRSIRSFDEITDVSPVTYPAYPDTSVALRSLEAWTHDHNEDREWREQLETLRRRHRQALSW